MRLITTTLIPHPTGGQEKYVMEATISDQKKGTNFFFIQWE